MKIKELKEIINQLDDDAEITITDFEQNNTYDIVECRYCEDKTSEYYKTYLDLIIEL